MRLGLLTFGVLIAMVGSVSAQFQADTSSYPRPGPQPSMLDQVGRLQQLELQRQQIQMGRLQLEQQRMQIEQQGSQERQADPEYRRQIEFERKQAEAYRRRHQHAR